MNPRTQLQIRLNSMGSALSLTRFLSFFSSRQLKAAYKIEFSNQDCISVYPPPGRTMTSNSITFRLATAQDAAPLVHLINASFRNDPTTEVFISAQNPTFVMTTLANIESKISDPTYTVIVAADHDGTLIGHCSVRKLDAERAWLGLLAVSVDSQNRGIGGQVVAYAERFVRREWGSRRMTFSVVCTRAGLIAWYTHRGYRLTGESEAFPYEHHDDWKGVLREGLCFVFMDKELGDE